jgi:hypothetical protein
MDRKVRIGARKWTEKCASQLENGQKSAQPTETNPPVTLKKPQILVTTKHHQTPQGFMVGVLCQGTQPPQTPRAEPFCQVVVNVVIIKSRLLAVYNASLCYALLMECDVSQSSTKQRNPIVCFPAPPLMLCQ